LRVELVAAVDASWVEAPAVRQAVQQLTQTGFQTAGVLAVKGNDRVTVAGFAAPQHQAYASMAKSGDNAFVTFDSHFSDGSIFEYSNAPVPFEVPCPDWFFRKRRVGASTTELWTAFLAERPAKALAECTVTGFAATSMDDVFRYQAWMAGRGGATRAELAVRFQAIGKLPAGEERESFLNAARSDEVDCSLCSWWRLQPDAPFALDEVLGSLIIVHDEMSLDWLANIYWAGTDDFKPKEPDFSASTPREAFARVVSNRGARLRRVYQKRTPLEADFYLPA
jgi:hypothetical protein